MVPFMVLKYKHTIFHSTFIVVRNVLFLEDGLFGFAANGIVDL